MDSVALYSALKGRTVSRQDLSNVLKAARKDDQFAIEQRIRALLVNYPNQDNFKVTRINLANRGLNGHGFLNGIEQMPFNFNDGYTDNSNQGLNRAVSPNEIYQYITDTVLQLIESKKELPWRKPWATGKGAGINATNFVTKKAYRGINALMLNLIYPQYPAYQWEKPYFLTFNQIEKLKGKLKKGAKGYRVVYFTQLYRWEDAEAGLEIGTYNRNKFIRWVKKHYKQLSINKPSPVNIETIVNWAQVPILKYYNVFNADMIEGIDWKLKVEPKEIDFKPVEIAEQIVDSWSNKPPIKNRGDKAFYSPGQDIVTMPLKTSFNSVPEYYGTLFHELVHSTGHKKRLDREMTGRFGSSDYAFEELIAELGASFLNGEAGMLFHTINNSAAYLKGWRKRLEVAMTQDNRFFFRAASAAQAAADFILERDKDGTPKYIRDDRVRSQAVKKQLQRKSKAKQNKGKRAKQLELSLNKSKDLWDHWDKLPKKIQKFTDQLNEALESGIDKDVKRIESLFKKAGYSFEYDMDGGVYGLHRVQGQNGVVDDLIDNANQVMDTVEKGKKAVKKLKNVLSIEEMLNMKFEKLKFTGKWAEFMQNVPPNLRLMVYGQGKNGKTSLSFQLAEYLSQFGPVLYNLADQGISATTQDLIRSTGLANAKNISLSGGRTIEELREAIQELDPQFIFIDLMNNYEIDPRTFEAFMKEEFPEKGFILVMEATKGEDFRGEGTWLNIVDAKIFCKDFVAYNNGRLGFGEFDIWPERSNNQK